MAFFIDGLKAISKLKIDSRMTCYHLMIKGKVQGVFFRQTARSVAMELGVSGWVRNTEEGHVEMMVYGEVKALAAFLDWCRIGPARSRVDELIQSPADLSPVAGFEIIH